MHDDPGAALNRHTFSVCCICCCQIMCGRRKLIVYGLDHGYICPFCDFLFSGSVLYFSFAVRTDNDTAIWQLFIFFPQLFSGHAVLAGRTVPYTFICVFQHPVLPSGQLLFGKLFQIARLLYQCHLFVQSVHSPYFLFFPSVRIPALFFPDDFSRQPTSCLA